MLCLADGNFRPKVPHDLAAGRVFESRKNGRHRGMCRIGFGRQLGRTEVHAHRDHPEIVMLESPTCVKRIHRRMGENTVLPAVFGL
jgi:hypothetical protein